MARDNLSFYERPERNDSVAVVGVPIEIGSDERGLAAAPRYLIDHGLEKVITSIGHEVSGIEMIPCPKPTRSVTSGRAKYLEEIAAISRASCLAVEKAVKKGTTVLTLGGDHAMAIGTISGAAEALKSEQRSLGVIWIDAHPDCNTHETSISGNIHGQVTSALMGDGHPLLTSVGGTERKVAPEHFLYIGLKDMDPLEIDYLREHSLKTVTMLDIADHGLSRAILAIDALCRKVDTIWVSMDLDSIDEEYAPGVGLATQGGLTRREVLGLAQYIGKTCALTGVDIVEILPAKDKDKKTAALALELVARFLGGEYNWYQSTYMEEYRQTNAVEIRNDLSA
jgi:arginase